MDTGFAGKGVVVTGASGGIGSACARAFAAEGARVVVHYHRGRDRAEALVAELADAVALGADLTDEAQVDKLFEGAREALGSVDVCAAVAGVWPSEDGTVWHLTLERWEETLRSNLTATFLTARAFLREVERNGHGNLVLVGSTAGRFGEAGHADYAAAKSAIQGELLLSLKNEIVRVAAGGRVNAVAPGWTYSPMTRGALDPGVVEPGVAHDGAAQGRAATPSHEPCSCSPRTSSRATSAASSSPLQAGWKAGRSIQNEAAPRGAASSSRRMIAVNPRRSPFS